MSLNLDVLDVLFDIRAAVTDLIVRVSPSNDADVASLGRLVRLRDQLNGAINRLIARNVGDATAGIEDALGKMQTASQNMATVSRDLAGVETAISIVGQVLSVAATIAGAAMTL